MTNSDSRGGEAASERKSSVQLGKKDKRSADHGGRLDHGSWDTLGGFRAEEDMSCKGL